MQYSGQGDRGPERQGSWAEVMRLKMEPDKENMKGKVAGLGECGLAKSGLKTPVRLEICENWRGRA